MSWISEAKKHISRLITSIIQDIKPWVLFICCIAILIAIIISLFLCFYLAFRRQRRRSENGHDPNPNLHHGIISRSTSSLDKRLLSSSFNGSSGCHNNQLMMINMVPLECGIIRPSNYHNYPTLLGKDLGYQEDINIKAARKSYSSSHHCFLFDEIVEITSNFDGRNLIGAGTYGKVYRGLLLDGTRVAIKELLLSSVKAEEFRLMMEAVPNITHKNLVKMIGFCVKEWHPFARYILVSEYVDNGNLHQWLHNNGDIISPLTWRIRMNIVSGIAKGLAYVHEDVELKMVHGRLQSCKVLLDRHWNPRISDFAVGGLLGLKHRLSTEAGYMAPELAITGDMNEKSDVYSFGILVMEMVSGRKPIDHGRPKEEIQLVEWLKSKVLEEDYEQILDPKIGQEPPLKELKRILLIALRCADFAPANRPEMGEVIHMLQPLDLLLSNGKEIVRRSHSQESQVFSQNFSDYRVSDNDRGDDSRHSNSNKQLAIVDIV